MITTIHLTNPRPCPLCGQPTHYAVTVATLIQVSPHIDPQAHYRMRLSYQLGVGYWSCPQCHATHNVPMVNEEDLP